MDFGIYSSTQSSGPSWFINESGLTEEHVLKFKLHMNVSMDFSTSIIQMTCASWFSVTNMFNIISFYGFYKSILDPCIQKVLSKNPSDQPRPSTTPPLTPTYRHNQKTKPPRSQNSIPNLHPPPQDVHPTPTQTSSNHRLNPNESHPTPKTRPRIHIPNTIQ